PVSLFHPPPPGEGENVNTTAAISKFPGLSVLQQPHTLHPIAMLWSNRDESVLGQGRGCRFLAPIRKAAHRQPRLDQSEEGQCFPMRTPQTTIRTTCLRSRPTSCWLRVPSSSFPGWRATPPSVPPIRKLAPSPIFPLAHQCRRSTRVFVRLLLIKPQ